MKNIWFRKAAALFTAAVISTTACAQQADFNEVGSKMAIMLQNSHFARIKFDAELSQKFLDAYLTDLDSMKLYFTQQDVERFSVAYGGELHTKLLNGTSMPAATEIYDVFKKRVQERVGLTDELLKTDFDFSQDESVMLTRKDAAWPRDQKQAESLWTAQIKAAVLAEILRREALTKLATEQGKPDPSLDDRSPKEKVALRYKRLLASVVDVDEEEVANKFFTAVARVYDPHTDYMSAREMGRFKDSMKNQLVGIGALLQAEEDGATKIMGIVVGGPADREGSLKLNDRVVGVNPLNSGRAEENVDIMFMPIDRVVDHIRGKVGTSVALKVEPAGGTPGETKMIVIERGNVEMKDEQAHGDLIEMKDKDGQPRRLGYLSLPSFYADFDEGTVRSSDDVERILSRFVVEKIDGLIVDLRNNGGGSLEEVRRMTGFFTERGPVVQVKNTLGQMQVKESDSGKPIYTGPMVVLTDKTSASASEILAGALQDANRAVVIGESSTFGKGTVQQPMDIGRMLPLFSERDRAGFLKVTIQKFYRPSGSSTQLDGVVPQIVLPSFMDAMEIGESYLDYALPHDRIRPAPNFKPMDEKHLFLPRLKELSTERVRLNQDFKYIIEDVMKEKERLKKNELSINKKAREAELVEEELMQKERLAERKKRFAEITEADRASMKFYKVTLDNVDQVEPFVAYDPSLENEDTMRRAKDENADLNETPKWPSGLDPVKRESLTILKDLIHLTDNAKLAGIIKTSVDNQ